MRPNLMITQEVNYIVYFLCFLADKFICFYISGHIPLFGNDVPATQWHWQMCRCSFSELLMIDKFPEMCFRLRSLNRACNCMIT